MSDPVYLAAPDAGELRPYVLKQLYNLADLSKQFTNEGKTLDAKGVLFILSRLGVRTADLGATFPATPSPGTLIVGIDPNTFEVVIDHPDLKPDENGVGHIVFSSEQARNLAQILMKKAAEADEDWLQSTKTNTIM